MKNYIKKPGVFCAFFLLIALNAALPQSRDESREITWTAIPDAPAAFCKAAGGIIGDYFYVFGGQPHTDLALAYSFADNAWTQSTPSPNRFHDAGYCVAGGLIYRISGKGSRNTAERFDPDGTGTGAWSPISSPPSPFRKEGNSCCWDEDNYIYINNSDNAGNPVGYFARYSIVDDNWEMLNPPYEPRRYAGIASLNDMIYLIGGVGDDDGDPHICHIYNPSGNYWGYIAPHPDPLNYANSTVISDGTRIWTVGHGGGYGNFPASAHVHYYDPAIDAWIAETDLPASRGFSMVGFHPATSRIVQSGGTAGNGMRFVSDGRIGVTTPLETGILTGIIVDNWYSNPVFEAEVSVFDYNNNLIGVDTTDEYGLYVFTLDPGTYSALYAKFSYLDSTIAGIVINSDDTTIVDITLTFQHQCDYVVGDVNGSWSYNGLDVTYLVAYLLHGGPPPVYECECTPGDIWYVSCDVDSSCTCDEGDIPPLLYQLKSGIVPFPTPCPDCPPINPAEKERP
jgi:hypothetical protein